MKITKVYFRRNDESSSWDGSESQHWFGEDVFQLEETVNGQKQVDNIQYGVNTHQLFIQVYANGKLYCEIPIQYVTRVYYGE